VETAKCQKVAEQTAPGQKAGFSFCHLSGAFLLVHGTVRQSTFLPKNAGKRFFYGVLQRRFNHHRLRIFHVRCPTLTKKYSRRQ
jgi:hypothetical protein